MVIWQNGQKAKRLYCQKARFEKWLSLIGPWLVLSGFEGVEEDI